MRSDRQHAFAAAPALRGIAPQLEIYEALLRRWQAKINLVGPSTIYHVWMRHFADSAQLFPFIPDDTRCVDLGSGAGFPGLVLALLLRGRPRPATFSLIESDHRKAAFLREVSRETGAEAEVITERAEIVVANSPAPAIITARAFAPMPRLIALTKPWLTAGATGLFLVGETDSHANNSDKLCVTSIPSRTGSGFVVTVRRGGSELS